MDFTIDNTDNCFDARMRKIPELQRQLRNCGFSTANLLSAERDAIG
jgi:hypothetical protein